MCALSQDLDFQQVNIGGGSADLGVVLISGRSSGVSSQPIVEVLKIIACLRRFCEQTIRSVGGILKTN